MMYLVDANVLSEPTKPVPSSKVIDWLTANERNLAVDSVIVGELCVGILSLPHGRKWRQLQPPRSRGILPVGKVLPPSTVGGVHVFLANSEFAVISIHASRTNCRNPSIFCYSNAATKFKPAYSKANLLVRRAEPLLRIDI
jgi:hypothetical protein